MCPLCPARCALMSQVVECLITYIDKSVVSTVSVVHTSAFLLQHNILHWHILTAFINQMSRKLHKMAPFYPGEIKECLCSCGLCP